MKLFADICKSESLDDGTLSVAGYASAEVVDASGETITADCIKAALPDYFKFGTGALREMHENIAAGAVTKAEVQEDGRTYIEGIVVDPVSIKKVQLGVLKGFSVGGKCLARDEVNKSVITKMKLTEISLVDRPCNPEAVLTMYKSDSGEDMSVDNQQEVNKAEDQNAEVSAVNVLAELINKGETSPQEILDLLKAKKEGDSEDGKYGDVAYADKENKKYPIDTEDHIRAAWSYINQEKNQKDYTAEEVQAIKDNIIAAWKKEIDKDGPPSAADDSEKGEKSELRKSLIAAFKPADSIEKGLYSLSNFACLLEDLAWLQASCEYESEYEGDSSPIPAKLAAAVANLGSILIEMAQEEVGELVQATQDDDAITLLSNTITAADTTGELKKSLDAIAIFKAGRRNSADDQERLQAAHDLLSDLGATCGMGDDEDEDEESLEMADKADGISKALNTLEKVSSELATLRKSHDAMALQYADLQKKYNDLPQQPKGVLRVVDKASEVSVNKSDTPEIEPVLKADGSVDVVATEMKKVFAGGGRQMFR